MQALSCLCHLRTTTVRNFSSSSLAAARQLPRFQKRRRLALEKKQGEVEREEQVYASVDEAEDAARRIPLDGHQPGQALPPIAQDPRLQAQKREPRLRWRDLGEGEPEPGVFSPARMPTNMPTSDSPKAQRIFLPNVKMMLVRNAPVPEWSPRASQQPYIATFRCSTQLTKPDIVQYLRQCYGLGMRSISTTIYRGPLVRGKHGGWKRKYPSYKKVVVGLEQPFEYPAGPSEHELEDRYAVYLIIGEGSDVCRQQRLRETKRRQAIYGDRLVRGWARRSFRYRGDGEGNVQRYDTIKEAIAARRSLAASDLRAKMAANRGKSSAE